MNLKNKYKKDYILLAGLREYVENGTILASVNFWRDSLQNFKELRTIDNRAGLLNSNSKYMESEFLVSFVKEDFPKIEEDIPENILQIALSIIENKEGRETLILTKGFLFEYAVAIAKSSKEDWLSFIGLKDSISDNEKIFLNKLGRLLDFQNEST
jgi:hypothetical protein